MQSTEMARRQVKTALAFALMAIPAIVFYVIVSRAAFRIPILDDYDTILGSLNWLSQHPGLSPKLLFILTNEHNGYKLLFLNSVVIGQYSALGKVYFLPLVALGNAIAGLIFITVLLMARPKASQPIAAWLFLVPIAWLILQLQYASALDFASSSLQHLAVILFALLSIYLLGLDSRWAFVVSCLALVLSIGSSPNGFFAGPAGLLMLGQSRRWRRFAAWTATWTAMLVVYLYRYHPLAAATGLGDTGGHAAHFNAGYALSFLGSSAARYSAVTPSVILGLLLCGVFAIAVYRRYFRQNPAIFYSMLFILINAAAVSVWRSGFGVEQSLASRYRIQSNLFLAFSYVFIVENLLPLWRRKWARIGFLVVSLVVSVAFCALSDWAGARFLEAKKQAVTESYRVEWQGETVPGPAKLSEAGSNPAFQRQIENGVYSMNLPVFREAVQRGIFVPPANP
jgi:hypothetical protein